MAKNAATRITGEARWATPVSAVAIGVVLVVAGYAALATRHPAWIVAAIVAAFAAGRLIGDRLPKV